MRFFSSEVKRMSARSEAADLIKHLAEPCPAGDSVKQAMLRAWRRLDGWSFNRVRDVWHADKRIVVSGDELDQLRDLTSDAKVVRNDLEDLLRRVSRIENALSISDADFYSPAIEGMRQAARPKGPLSARSGEVHRAVDGA